MSGPRMQSKNGCWTCRLRRKKCDEEYPLCESLWMGRGSKETEAAQETRHRIKQVSYHESCSSLAPGQNSKASLVASSQVPTQIAYRVAAALFQEKLEANRFNGHQSRPDLSRSSSITNSLDQTPPSSRTSRKINSGTLAEPNSHGEHLEKFVESSLSNNSNLER